MAFSKTTLQGYGIMLVFISCWTASGVSVQLLEKQVPDFQLGVIRYFGAAVCAFILVFIEKADFKVPGELWGYMLLLAVSAVACAMPLFVAAAVLPITHVACVPLVFTIIAIASISRVALSESITFLTLLTITGCTLGTTLLVQPWEALSDGFIPGFIQTTSDSVKANGSSPSFSSDLASSYSIWMPIFGYFCCALSGIFDAVYLLLGGVITRKVTPCLTVLIISILSVPICGILSIYVEEPVWITNSYSLFLVFIHMVSAGIGLIAETMALRFISPAQVGILKTLGAVFNLIPQYTILSAHLSGKMNVLEVAGCIVIVLSIVMYELKSIVVPHEDFHRE